MKSKYTLQVKIRIRGSKRVATGYSKYSNQSYNKKYENAVLYAYYTYYHDILHKKFRYNTPMIYEDVGTPSMAYTGKKKIHLNRRTTNKLHDKLLLDRQKLSEKKQHIDKPISKKRQHKELYGDETMNKKDYEKMTKEELIKLLMKERKNKLTE